MELPKFYEWKIPPLTIEIISLKTEPRVTVLCPDTGLYSLCIDKVMKLKEIQSNEDPARCQLGRIALMAEAISSKSSQCF
jgi:hypothetical protein